MTEAYDAALAKQAAAAVRKEARKAKGIALGLRGNKAKRKKLPSRKSLVRKADAAFSLKVRELYPVSFFSGKPTECCFHIITRSKHSVRWSLNNAVGSTMGENYEMEFNPHKFISILIQKHGLPWYEELIRQSNKIRKFTREDLQGIIERGHDGDTIWAH